MQVRIGSLVMWNKKESQDYGCMGIVAHILDSDLLDYYYFTVEWTDNSVVEYGSDEIEGENIKVVNF